ncbi:hypothetical protein L6452_42360 [Arctium lappa]|uniref:Uncharacterized protein n=1 Tax=Arctium lappa TaxID=4217 RepID=A0ACB8XJ92_ARCLA|nr:hypothetical protein L6452_42360 [Arctium lappa]
MFPLPLWNFQRVVTVRYGNYSDNHKWEVIGSCMRQGIMEAFLLGKEPIELTKRDVGRLIDARFRGRNLFQGWEDCNTPTFERFWKFCLENPSVLQRSSSWGKIYV